MCPFTCHRVEIYLKHPSPNLKTHALAQLNALHQFVVTVLLGTNPVFYAGKTLKDF